MKKIYASLIVCFSLIFVLSLCFINLGGRSMKADTKPVYYIITTPGEDASTMISMNWHAENSGSYLEYTFADDTKFEKAIKVMPTEEYWSTEGIKNTQPDNGLEVKRYVCSVSLENLNVATKYIYRVVSGDFISNTYNFTTAGLTNTWNFVAFTDFQCRHNTISHPLIRQMLEIGKNPNLVICSGDEVDVAGDIQDWDWFFNTDETIFTNFIYASSPGDHEYWGASIDGKYPQYDEPWTYNKLFNYPKNGCAEALNSNYYFYYNNVLFVALDMGDSNTVSSTKMNKEVTWMKETIKKLEGTYQYLVVFDHKSIYGAYDEDSRVATNIRPQWYPVFDACNVDLVLSGHDHMFSRTYRLYNNKVSTTYTKGTYYLDMGSSGDKRRVTEEKIAKDGLHEVTYNLSGLGLSCGANIEVSPEEMVVTVYDNYKNVKDKFTIKAKRAPLEINCEQFKEDEFFDSVSMSVTGKHDGVLKIAQNNSIKFVDKVTVLSDSYKCINETIDYNNVLDEYPLIDIYTSKVKLQILLKDGRTFEKDFDLDLGSLSNLNTLYENNKFYITFSGMVYKIINYKANLYIDGTLYNSISSDELEDGKVEVPSKYLHGNHKFDIKFEFDGSVLKEFTLNYDTYKELSLSVNNLDLQVGGEVKLDYTYDYKELVSLKSSNPSVVSIDEEGNIKAISEGSARIEISVVGISDPYIVNVNVTKVPEKGGCGNAAASIIFMALSLFGYAYIKRRRYF